MSATLKPGAISLFESVIMGIAGSAPGFSIATTAAVLLATAGSVSINALLVFAVPMLGIAVAYKGLNKRLPRAGAAYDWTTESFGKFLGFLSGWALLIATLVFIVSGSLTVLVADPADFDAMELDLLGQIANALSYGLVVLRDRQDKKASVARLHQSIEATVVALAAMLDERDPYTADHQ